MGGAIATAVILGASASAFASPDADGEGIVDTADAFPCDDNAVGTIFVPAQGDHGSLFFEDMWPLQTTDDDFNDVVLTYNYAYRVNRLGEVVSLRMTFNALALGGDNDMGLMITVPVAANKVDRVMRSVGTDPAQVLTPSAADTNLTVTLSPNLRELFGGVSGPINVIPGMPVLHGRTMEVEIVFTNPEPLSAVNAPYDVAIFHASRPSHEIHLPDYSGSANFNTSLLGTGVDGSTSTRHFVNTAGLPYGLHFPTTVAWAPEKVNIVSVYPRITTFASSGGVADQDFYLNGVVQTAAYTPPMGQTYPTPGFIGPDHSPAETGCIIEWGMAAEFGLSLNQYIYASALDSAGHVVVVGYGRPLTSPPSSPYYGQDPFDIFVAKYDGITGAEIWSNLYGGTGYEMGRGVAIDANDRIYVVGETQSDLNGNVNAGGADAFIMVLNPNGTEVWTKLFGGSGIDLGYGIVVDGAGDIVIGGGSTSNDIPGVPYMGGSPGSFLTKFSSTGTRRWAKQFAIDTAHASNLNYTGDIGLDTLTGNIYSVGTERRYSQSANATENPFITLHSGTDGAILWTKHIGDYGFRDSTTSQRRGYAYRVSVDGIDGSAYIGGQWYLGSSISSWGPWTRAAGDFSADAFLMKVTAAGNVGWTHSISSVDRADDVGESVVVDQVAGRVYFAGRTRGTLPGQSSNGAEDYFITAFDHMGNQLWLQQNGTDKQDVGHVGEATMLSQTTGTVRVIGNSIGRDTGNNTGLWEISVGNHDYASGAFQTRTIAQVTTWATGWWSACSATCGAGTQTRPVVCEDGIGRALDPQHCLQTRPAATQACIATAGCTATWNATAWSACSNSCGAGVQSRTVTCDTSAGARAASGACAGLPQPKSARACIGDSSCTYGYFAGAWSACSTASTCSTGHQTRTVYCARSDGAQVNNGFCTGTRPTTAQSCNVACPATAQNCDDLYNSGITQSGTYDINPKGAGAVSVYCDMSQGGGFTNVDFTANRLILENGHFVACTGGLTTASNSLTCVDPRFDADPNKRLYMYQCDGSDRSADYLLDHVAPLIGHKGHKALGYSSMSKQYMSNLGASTGNHEYCYVAGQVVPFSDPLCQTYGKGNNGNCVVSSFALTR